MVDCWFGVVEAGAGGHERENTSGILGGNGAGEDKAVTPGDLCTFRAPNQPFVRRRQGDAGLLQRH